VAAVFTTGGNWFYCANWTLNAMLNRKKKSWWISALLFGAVYLVAMMPRNVEDLFHYWEWIGYAGFATTLFLPLMFWILAMIRRVDHREEKGGESDAMAAS
jgi:spore germination protein